MRKNHDVVRMFQNVFLVFHRKNKKEIRMLETLFLTAIIFISHFGNLAIAQKEPYYYDYYEEITMKFSNYTYYSFYDKNITVNLSVKNNLNQSINLTIQFYISYSYYYYDDDDFKENRTIILNANSSDYIIVEIPHPKYFDYYNHGRFFLSASVKNSSIQLNSSYYTDAGLFFLPYVSAKFISPALNENYTNKAYGEEFSVKANITNYLDKTLTLYVSGIGYYKTISINPKETIFVSYNTKIEKNKEYMAENLLKIKIDVNVDEKGRALSPRNVNFGYEIKDNKFYNLTNFWIGLELFDKIKITLYNTYFSIGEKNTTQIEIKNRAGHDLHNLKIKIEYKGFFANRIIADREITANIKNNETLFYNYTIFPKVNGEFMICFRTNVDNIELEFYQHIYIYSPIVIYKVGYYGYGENVPQNDEFNFAINVSNYGKEELNDLKVKLLIGINIPRTTENYDEEKAKGNVFQSFYFDIKGFYNIDDFVSVKNKEFRIEKLKGADIFGKTDYRILNFKLKAKASGSYGIIPIVYWNDTITVFLQDIGSINVQYNKTKLNQIIFIIPFAIAVSLRILGEFTRKYK